MSRLIVPRDFQHGWCQGASQNKRIVSRHFKEIELLAIARFAFYQLSLPQNAKRLMGFMELRIAWWWGTTNRVLRGKNRSNRQKRHEISAFNREFAGSSLGIFQANWFLRIKPKNQAEKIHEHRRNITRSPDPGFDRSHPGMAV